MTNEPTAANAPKESSGGIGAKLAQAKAFPGLKGMDLAKVVSITEPKTWTEGSWELGKGYVTPSEFKYHVVAFDYGVKNNILRMLADRGCKVTLVPA